MKKTKLGLAKKGFTIIEVVLVLAIAGLIFLMVFYVVPQAMAGQRDGERRQAMARVQSALVQYQTNNRTKRNNLPGAGKAVLGENDNFCSDGAACSFIKNYMNSTNATENSFLDPDGVPYQMLITENMAQANPTDFAASLTFNDASKLEVSSEEGATTTTYTIGGTKPFNEHVVYIIPGGQCDGENVVKSELRHFAVMYQLEGSGIYCGDSD